MGKEGSNPKGPKTTAAPATKAEAQLQKLREKSQEQNKEIQRLQKLRFYC